uniref:Protein DETOXIFICATION n=1 Tax=Oryza meridionalis TaxID=40149 RepID=A0A0E0EWU5_9ORYZ
MEKPAASVEEPLLLGAGEKKGESAAAAELKRLLRLAGPLVASGVLRNVVQMVSVMFVGHLGELPLAGASLATSLANVTGFSLLFGMASALDTLCGQAYGARQHHLLGVYKQRAMLVLAVAAMPIALVWASAGEILLLFGQDPAIAAEAGAYARWLIPSLVPFVPLVCHIRFLQAQSAVLPVMASCGVTAASHVAVCWALVRKAGMGSRGAALANAYAELAIPAAMMVCLEWWSFEFLVMLSGLLPNPKLETSVLSICLNTGALLVMVPIGLSTAISTRVSNELGAGNPQAAKLATRVVICMAMTEGSVVAFTMILLRNSWGHMYSDEAEVVTYIARMIPVLAISFFIDGMHSALSGVLTGCGKQKIGARVNLSAFYLAGIPMAVLLAFVLHLNGMGLWLGIICGSLSKLILLFWITMSINWEKESTRAKELVFSSSLPVA